MSEKTYIGITIGPIFNTMNLVSSPAALWASSYMFSCISKKICEKILEKGVNKKDIITPFINFDESDETETLLADFSKKGIGLFHDRIIFEKGNFDIQDFKGIRKKVIEEIVSDFKLSEETNPTEFLNNFLLIAAAEFEAENPIIGSGKILDCLELSAPLCYEENINPILYTFSDAYVKNGDEQEYDGKKNKSIINITKGLGIDDWQLGSNKIKSLPDIADTSEGGEELKKHSYYAIVRADGDNMSKIIASLKEKDDFNDFSKTCFKYCAGISNRVREFGGVTIYAGGDDLLALLPCQNGNGQTVFDFFKTVNEIFNQSFKTYIDAIKMDNEQKKEKDKTPVPTLSIGAFISYVKFPLYEALDESASLLFKNAKSIKNCVAVKLQKHSGQSAGVIIPNEKIDALIDLQNTVFRGTKSEEDKERFLLSASQKISLFSVIFDTVPGDNAENIFKNTFDNEYQKSFESSINSMVKFFKDIDCKKMKCISDDDEKEDSKAAIMEMVLRILKFYTEKRGYKS